MLGILIFFRWRKLRCPTMAKVGCREKLGEAANFLAIKQHQPTKNAVCVG